MEFGRSRLSEPTPEDLNHLHIPDFTMGAPVKTARHDLLWALATAQQPHTYVLGRALGGPVWGSVPPQDCTGS